MNALFCSMCFPVYFKYRGENPVNISSKCKFTEGTSAAGMSTSLSFRHFLLKRFFYSQ